MKISNDIENKKSLVIDSLKHIALLTIVAGTYALIFEVKYFSDFSINIYFGRLLATLIGFIILLLINTQFGKHHAIALIHLLLISITLSFASIIYMIPKTLFVNSHLLALTIFTTALFLSWDTKNQIIVAIYYNLIFSASILFNDSTIYFLPNFFSTVIFILMISVLSIGATSINSRLRENLIMKSLEIKEIFDNSFEGMFRINRDGDLYSANNSFYTILNITKSDSTKINLKGLLFSEAEFNKIVQHVNEHGFVHEYIVQTEISSKVRNINLNLRISNYRHAFFDGSILDVTDKMIAKNRRHEAYLKLLEAKSLLKKTSEEAQIQSDNKIQFLAKINHDLKTPINSISIILDMITTNIIKDEDELKEYASAAKISTYSILSTLDKYLDFTKIEAGHLELETELFTLKELLDECKYLLIPMAESKGISLVFELGKSLPNLVEGDAIHYKQIIVNLVTNAIKFTNDGEVKVHMKMGKDLEDKFEIITKVSDTGVGIPEEKIDGLFKAYSQVDRKRDYRSGSGLGLMISSEFVNLLGGEIHLKSKLGLGSTFTFNAIFNKVKIPDEVS